MKAGIIDDVRAPGAWADAISREEKRKADNTAITERNARIQRAWRFAECPHAIALREGVSVHYVRQIGPRWKA